MSSTTTDSSTESTADTASSTTDIAERGSTTGEVLFETSPTIKPTLLFMGIVLFSGVVIEAILVLNPGLVGGPEAAEILIYAIGFLFFMVLLRSTVRMLILERTTYRVTSETIRREYQLLYRYTSREIPFSELRAHETRRNRLQMLLGYGTVRFLTGGTNESLGFVSFENIIELEELRDIVQPRL